jgi:hypothetical protein
MYAALFSSTRVLNHQVVYVFFSFSTFSQFHPLLSQNQVGVGVLRMIELEVKRFAVRTKELEEKKAGESEPWGEGLNGKGCPAKSLTRRRKRFAE